jgi:PAS domain S-box-containing protein
LFEAAQDGILVLDGETGQVIDANPVMRNLLGYSQQEILGRKLWEIVPFLGASASKIAFAELQRADSLRHEGLLLEAKDGQRVEVEFISNSYLMGQRRVIQCNIRDITERKKTEQRMSLLNTCISNLNEIVLVTEAEVIDEPGPRILFVNEAFERITGYTSAEALGQSPRFLQGEKTDRRVLKEIRQALAQQQPIHRQIINYKKDGTEYWMDVDIVPVITSSHLIALRPAGAAYNLQA